VTRYQFIDDQQARYPVDLLVESLEVSRSGYYEWRDRPLSARAERRAELAQQVHEMFLDHQGIYGSRKIAVELVEREVRVCRNTVAKMMREMNLRSKTQRKRSFTLTTDSNHAEPIAPNLLGRDFTAAHLNEKWVADITYIPMKESFAYLAAVMDLHSRRIVGWSVSESLDTSVVLEALEQAIQTRRPREGMIHHSDRGCQYASGDHRSLLKAHGIECSMSRRGDCWDNAPMERFMSSLKNEWTNHRSYETADAVHGSVFEYIEIFYNRRRRHQALGYLSPAEFETQRTRINAA
jgi:transposase InsO family protein